MKSFHRDPSNEPNLLVTLCIRCHVRIHRSLGVRYWPSGLLLKLRRELHQHEPMQLRLTLRPVTERQCSQHAFVQAGSAVLAPFSPRHADREVPEPRAIYTAPALFERGVR